MTTIYELPERSQSLSAIIQKTIAKHGGKISFAKFMELALYHPEFGYYTADTIELGEHGDFTTAPEISPLFAQCFSHQIQQIATNLSNFSILELGAGSGRFAKDLLLALKNLNALPAHYYIYEISPALRKKQRHLFERECPELLSRVEWLETLPKKFIGVIVANEVLDALPVQRFRNDASGMKEICVAWENGQFVSQYSEPITPGLAAEAQKISDLYALPPDYESEICLALTNFLEQLTQALEKGVILLADYGYGQREYYHPQRNQGTLTCFYQHKKSTNPYVLPGMQDITAHVDFTRVIENAANQDCTLLGYTTQAAFLMACGLLDMAADTEKNLTTAQEFSLHQAIKMLTLPTEMGERIKIMGLGKNWAPPLLGFTLQDRRRDL